MDTLTRGINNFVINTELQSTLTNELLSDKHKSVEGIVCAYMHDLVDNNVSFTIRRRGFDIIDNINRLEDLYIKVMLMYMKATNVIFKKILKLVVGCILELYSDAINKLAKFINNNAVTYISYIEAWDNINTAVHFKWKYRIQKVFNESLGDGKFIINDDFSVATN